MQTFLPLPDFKESLACLDNRRLGKQRSEAKTIIRGGWVNHPASKMWKGYKRALITYYNLCLQEWEQRGFKNLKLQPLPSPRKVVMPSWFGEEEFHRSHRVALLTKDYDHYQQFGWKEEPDYEYYYLYGKHDYVWPVRSRSSVTK